MAKLKARLSAVVRLGQLLDEANATDPVMGSTDIHKMLFERVQTMLQTKGADYTRAFYEKAQNDLKDEIELPPFETFLRQHHAFKGARKPAEPQN